MKVGKFEQISTFNITLIPKFLLLAGLLVFCSLVPAEPQSAGDAQEESLSDFESKLNELLTTVYCYCGCERETIEVCVCGTAVHIENDFRNRLLAGQKVEQIRTNYLETYGPQFYAVMPAKGINLIAYITPAIILVLLGGVALAVLRKSRRQVALTTDREGASGQPISNTTLKQVEAELKKYKDEK